MMERGAAPSASNVGSAPGAREPALRWRPRVDAGQAHAAGALGRLQPGSTEPRPSWSSEAIAPAAGRAPLKAAESDAPTADRVEKPSRKGDYARLEWQEGAGAAPSRVGRTTTTAGVGRARLERPRGRVSGGLEDKSGPHTHVVSEINGVVSTNETSRAGRRGGNIALHSSTNRSSTTRRARRGQELASMAGRVAGLSAARVAGLGPTLPAELAPESSERTVAADDVTGEWMPVGTAAARGSKNRAAGTAQTSVSPVTASISAGHPHSGEAGRKARRGNKPLSIRSPRPRAVAEAASTLVAETQRNPDAPAWDASRDAHAELLTHSEVAAGALSGVAPIRSTVGNAGAVDSAGFVKPSSFRKQGIASPASAQPAVRLGGAVLNTPSPGPRRPIGRHRRTATAPAGSATWRRVRGDAAAAATSAGGGTSATERIRKFELARRTVEAFADQQSGSTSSLRPRWKRSGSPPVDSTQRMSTRTKVGQDPRGSKRATSPIPLSESSAPQFSSVVNDASADALVDWEARPLQPCLRPLQDELMLMRTLIDAAADEAGTKRSPRGDIGKPITREDSPTGGVAAHSNVDEAERCRSAHDGSSTSAATQLLSVGIDAAAQEQVAAHLRLRGGVQGTDDTPPARPATQPRGGMTRKEAMLKRALAEASAIAATVDAKSRDDETAADADRPSSVTDGSLRDATAPEPGGGTPAEAESVIDDGTTPGLSRREFATLVMSYTRTFRVALREVAKASPHLAAALWRVWAGTVHASSDLVGHLGHAAALFDKGITPATRDRIVSDLLAEQKSLILQVYKLREENQSLKVELKAQRRRARELQQQVIAIEARKAGPAKTSMAHKLTDEGEREAQALFDVVDELDASELCAAMPDWMSEGHLTLDSRGCSDSNDGARAPRGAQPRPRSWRGAGSHGALQCRTF